MKIKYLCELCEKKMLNYVKIYVNFLYELCENFQSENEKPQIKNTSIIKQNYNLRIQI